MLVGKLQGVIVKTFLLPYESNIKAGLWLRGPGADSRVDRGGARAELELLRGTPSMAQSLSFLSCDAEPYLVFLDPSFRRVNRESMRGKLTRLL